MSKKDKKKEMTPAANAPEGTHVIKDGKRYKIEKPILNDKGILKRIPNSKKQEKNMKKPKRKVVKSIEDLKARGKKDYLTPETTKEEEKKYLDRVLDLKNIKKKPKRKVVKSIKDLKAKRDQIDIEEADFQNKTVPYMKRPKDKKDLKRPPVKRKIKKAIIRKSKNPNPVRPNTINVKKGYIDRGLLKPDSTKMRTGDTKLNIEKKEYYGDDKRTALEKNLQAGKISKEEFLRKWDKKGLEDPGINGDIIAALIGGGIGALAGGVGAGVGITGAVGLKRAIQYLGKKGIKVIRRKTKGIKGKKVNRKPITSIEGLKQRAKDLKKDYKKELNLEPDGISSKSNARIGVESAALSSGITFGGAAGVGTAKEKSKRAKLRRGEIEYMNKKRPKRKKGN